MSVADEVFERRRLASAPRRATVHDAEAAAQTLSAAFADDPVTSWIGRRDAKKDTGRLAMFRHLVTHVGVRGNELWVASDFSVAALWLPPVLAEMKQPLLEELKLIPTLLSFTGWSGLARVNAFRKAADAHHPKAEPHFYLMTIGVNPRFQGQGLGSAMLDATLANIDAAGSAAYLESSSPKNVPLYRRHGFEVINEFRPRSDAPPLWGMWRKAKA
jgi:ribosomal protein S18 acetylase RimI-like enzyme